MTLSEKIDEFIIGFHQLAEQHGLKDNIAINVCLFKSHRPGEQFVDDLGRVCFPIVEMMPTGSIDIRFKENNGQA